MKRKTIIYSIIILVLLIAITVYALIRPNNEGMIKIGYNVESVNHAPAMVAYDAGIYDRYNLSVELVPLKSGKEVQQALAVGRVDIGFSGVTNFFIPISKHAPVKVIGPCAVSTTQVFVRPDSNIIKIKDLENKTIASRLGGSSNLALAYALRKENVDLGSINFVDIEKTVRLMALMDKKIVEAAAVGYYESKLYLEGGAIVLEEWITKGYINKSFPRTVVGVNTDFMKENKDKVDTFVDAYIEAHKFIKENNDKAALIISEHIKDKSDRVISFSVEDIKDSWEGLDYVLWHEPEDFVEISNIEYEIGDIESNLSLEQIFDFTFEEKLKNAQELIYE